MAMLCAEMFTEMTLEFPKQPYKHNRCIPRWNDVETVVSTSFQRGIHVMYL